MTFDLNDKVVLGNVPEAGAEDKRVTLDGIEGNISVGSGISLMYNGMAHIGAIQFNQDEQYTQVEKAKLNSIAARLRDCRIRTGMLTTRILEAAGRLRKNN